MPESFVRNTRRIYRQEDYVRNPVGRVSAVNSDGTFAVQYRTRSGSLLTVNLTNGSGVPLYVGSVVTLARRSRNGALDIVGLSARTWAEPEIIAGS